MKNSGKPKSPPQAPAPTPEPPKDQKPTPIDQKTIDIILAADLANIVKKVKAGKPLSNSEREILAQRRAKAPATTQDQPPPPDRTNDYHIPTLLEQALAALKDDNETKNRGGRPKFKIDYKLVASAASIQCTQEEIAALMGCTVDTLQRDPKFCGMYKKNFERGKMSLRRHQWRAVEVDRNPTMMIWLGKQYLGQRDRHEVTGKIEKDDTSADERLRQLPTAELRRLLGPGDGAIIDVTEVTNGTNGHQNGTKPGHNRTNGANGHH